MMIDHVAIWVRDIERTREFFERHFGATSGTRYDNAKGFSSYFLTFPDCSTRIEAMQSKELIGVYTSPSIGNGHIAFSVGSKENVNILTATLQSEGHRLLSGPRTTGDGYYESCLRIFNDFLLELTV